MSLPEKKSAIDPWSLRKSSFFGPDPGINAFTAGLEKI
jgi:hypothetical protein